MEHITLFTDILPEEQERMRVCFHAREIIFKNGEMIMEYSSSMKKIGLIQEGRAVLYCCDEDGNEYVIDELNKDSVFGEPFLLPADSQHYYVCATTDTKVMFIDYEHVIKRCENACHHHSQMISNLLQISDRDFTVCREMSILQFICLDTIVVGVHHAQRSNQHTTDD